jgi:hypothetical protein
MFWARAAGPIRPEAPVSIQLFALQRPGLPALTAMSATGPGGDPLAPLGAEVARLVDGLGVRVAFLPTGGSGVTPWRKRIALDRSYQGAGQAERPSRVALVAHELTHLLQRELDDPVYWPSGGLTLSAGRRVLGDSTNYMEALAYAVGWSLEYDLRRAAGEPRGSLRTLEDRLATVAAPDAANAARFVVSLFPSNRVYRSNYAFEKRQPDGRIPPGGWRHWMQRQGFSAASLDHLGDLAALGTSQTVTVEQLEQILAGR